jgi:hypothetical protein
MERMTTFNSNAGVQRRRRVLLVATAALCAVALTGAARPDSLKTARKKLSLVKGEVTFEPAAGGEVKAVLKPRGLPAGRAPIEDGEWVLGVAHGDTAAAYPLRALAGHEVVNDWLGRYPIAVTWSPLSASAAVYVRRLGERRLTMGVSDRLWRGHRVLFDAETSSLWSQLLGECLQGELEGQRLGELPCVLARWVDWRRAYPETRVMDPDGAPGVEPFTATTGAPAAAADVPAGLSPGDPVMGVLIGRTAKAYPFAVLRRERVIEDRIGRQPTVLFYDEASGAVAAYSRRLSGLEVHFERAASDGVIRDVGTQSRWDWLRGAGVDGKMAGVSLTRLPATPAFWFAWRDLFPETQIYRSAP